MVSENDPDKFAFNMIKTDTDYEKALERLEIIFDAQPGTAEGDELEQLSLLIENFESQHHPIDPPDPSSAGRSR